MFDMLVRNPLVSGLVGVIIGSASTMAVAPDTVRAPSAKIHRVRIAQEFHAPPSGDSSGQAPSSGGTFAPPPPPTGGEVFGPPPTGGTFGQPSTGTFGPPPGGTFGSPYTGGESGHPSPDGHVGPYGSPPGAFPGQSGTFPGKTPSAFPGQGEFRGAPGEFPGGPSFGRPEFGGTETMGESRKGYGSERGYEGREGFGRGEGQEGSLEEESDKFQKQQEERQAKEEQRMLQQMKKEVRNMKRMVSQVEVKAAKLERKGVAVPAELKEALSSAQSAISAIENAQSFEELQNSGALETLPEAFNTLNNASQVLDQLEQWPRMVKEVDREIKQLDKALSRAKSRKLAVDVSGLLGEWEQKLGVARSARDEANSLAQAGSFEEAQAALGATHEAFEDVRAAQNAFEAAVNFVRAKKQIEQVLRQAERTVTRLSRKGLETSELAQIVAEAKATYSEVQSLMKSDPEAAFELISSLFELQAQFQEKAQELEPPRAAGRTSPSKSGLQLPSVFQQFGGESQ